MANRSVWTTILISTCLSIGGCCFPIPYTSQSYISDAPFPPISAPRLTPELEPYFVATSFVKARVIDDDAYAKGDPVFHFLIGVKAGEFDVDRVVLHGLIVRVDGTEMAPVSIHDSGSSVRRSLPLTDPFVVMPPHYVSSEEIDGKAANLEQVELIIDIEVDTNGISERKIVRHAFRREVTRHLFSCAEV